MSRRFQGRQRQRGISVFIVMIMALLGSLLVLWSSRAALLNEMLTGNDSDYQRAIEAAQAMIRDAELDIRGEDADGSPCAAPVCRSSGVLDVANKQAFFPSDANQLLDLQTLLASSSPSCIAGICVPGNLPAQFWTSKTNLDAMKQVAATYGAYTGARTGDGDRAGNPLLAPDKAWYWVEILPYDMGAATGGGAARELAPDRETPYVYRITTVVKGLKPATQVVIQTTIVWKKVSS
jgi:type IV pilus assembly protein PilX